ncbi:unnamed protein product [Ascophyllum nodosum]
MPESDKGFSNAPRSKSWKGVTRTRSNRTTGNDVSGGSHNIFRAAWTFFREGSKRSSKNVSLDPTDHEHVHAVQGGGDRGSTRNYNHERNGNDNRRYKPERKRPGNAKGNVTEARTDRGSTPLSQSTPEDADVKPVSRKTRASKNGADTDSPSSCSSLDSNGSADTNKEDNTAVGPAKGADASAGDRSLSTPAEALPPLYETLFPLGRSAGKAEVDAKAGDSAAIAAAPAFVKAARSRSDRHVLMRGTSSVRQRASVSFRRMLTTSNEVSPSAGASPPQGFHPQVNDTAAMRAAYGKKGPLFGDVFAGAPRKPKNKVMLHDQEKNFIRSLHEIDVWDRSIINASPPLLGPDRAQNYAPMASPQAAAWGLKGMRHDKNEDRTLVPVGPKKTLVLDLDETLISSRRTPCNCDFKIVFKVHYEETGGSGDNFAANAGAPPAEGGSNKNVNGSSKSNDITNKVREVRYYVRLRPGLTKFLEKTSALYELVVWTASGKSYADAVIDLLDPDGKYFSYRLYREACTRHKGLNVKDLRRLGRPMDSVILIDNYVYSFGFTLDNGIPISPWTGNEEAKESGLKMAYTLLKHVARVPDVRVPLITAFDLYKTIHGTRPHLPPPSMAPADVSTSSFPRTTATAPPPLTSVFASSPGAFSEGETRTTRGVAATLMKEQ